MSRLNSLFESATTPGQQYARQPLVSMRFEKDPSLRRVLAHKGYFDGTPQRIGMIAQLMQDAAQKARAHSGVAGKLWDQITTHLSTMATALDQDLSIAGHRPSDATPCKPSVQAQSGLLDAWKGLFRDETHQKSLTALLDMWQATVDSLASDPASGEYSKAYTNYSKRFAEFRGHLNSSLKDGPEADVIAATPANTLDTAVLESHQASTNEAKLPRSFAKALNHTTPQKDVTDALSWAVANRSGFEWSGDLLNFVNGLADVADYLQEPGSFSMFTGKLDDAIAKRLATSLVRTDDALQGALVNGLTDGLKEAGLWEESPEDASRGRMPQNLARIFHEYDYYDLSNNMLFAMASINGAAMIGMYEKLPVAMKAIAKDVQSGKLLAGLSSEQRKAYEGALTGTSRDLTAALRKLRTAFKQEGMLDNPVPASREIN